MLFDNKLYRSTHKTFAAYCKDTFDFEKSYSYYQLDFSRINEKLSTRVENLPSTEYQARPLTTLPTPELQAQAWEQAQADSGKTQPSNRQVAEAVAKVQAELDAERQARELFECRAKESQDESNERRKKIRELEAQIDLLEAKTATPEKVEVPPADYETAKAKAAEFETELNYLRKQQDKLVNDQVKAKLHERQAELDKLEQDKQLLDEVVARKKAYLASLDSDLKRIETHQKVIEENRLHMISLAAFLSDEEPIQDAETLKRWRALADMLGEAMTAVHQYAGDAKPVLTVIAGGAA